MERVKKMSETLGLSQVGAGGVAWRVGAAFVGGALTSWGVLEVAARLFGFDAGTWWQRLLTGALVAAAMGLYEWFWYRWMSGAAGATS